MRDFDTEHLPNNSVKPAAGGNASLMLALFELLERLADPTRPLRRLTTATAECWRPTSRQAIAKQRRLLNPGSRHSFVHGVSDSFGHGAHAGCGIGSTAAHVCSALLCSALEFCQLM